MRKKIFQPLNILKKLYLKLCHIQDGASTKKLLLHWILAILKGWGIWLSECIEKGKFMTKFVFKCWLEFQKFVKNCTSRCKSFFQEKSWFLENSFIVHISKYKILLQSIFEILDNRVTWEWIGPHSSQINT